jgi:hypothetical protein
MPNVEQQFNCEGKVWKLFSLGFMVCFACSKSLFNLNESTNLEMDLDEGNKLYV